MIDLRGKPSPNTITATLVCDCCGARGAHVRADAPQGIAHAVRARGRSFGWHTAAGVDEPDWCAACDRLERGDRNARMVLRAMGAR